MIFSREYFYTWSTTRRRIDKQEYEIQMKTENRLEKCLVHDYIQWHTLVLRGTNLLVVFTKKSYYYRYDYGDLSTLSTTDKLFRYCSTLTKH
jgi:hypothetical protein